MKTETRTIAIIIPREKLDQLQAFLDGEGEDKVGTVETFTADFGNGIQADIKVCEGDPPFVDPVLFHNGCEICVGEVADTLEGEYSLFDGDTEYKVIVKADKPKPLRCETNTAEMAADIEAAFIDWANDGNWTPPEEDGGMVGQQDVQTDFEHGQWFVTHKPTGAQWSVHDANEDEWDFEQISVGDSE